MRHIYIILTFLIICSSSASQIIDHKYISAVNFIKDSIDTYSEFNICYPNISKEKREDNYTGFNVADEINYFDMFSFIKEYYKVANLNIDSSIFNGFKKDSINYMQYSQEGLNLLSTNKKSVLYLYFSKPYKNFLIAKIIPCQDLMFKRYHARKWFLRKKGKIEQLQINKSYRYNTASFHRQMTILTIRFVFDSHGQIIYWDTKKYEKTKH